MVSALSGFRRQQAITGAFMTALVVTLVSFFMFRGMPHVPVQGGEGLAIDMLPTTFMSAVMAFLVPATVCAKMRKAGRFEPHHVVRDLPWTRLAWLAFVRGAFSLIIVGLPVCAVLYFSGLGQVGFWTTLVGKALFGGILGWFVTLNAVKTVLCD